MKRPTSISVIAWILIVMSGINLLTSTMNLNNPIVRELMEKSLLPISLQFTILYAGLLITIVSGVAMLKGQNWARFLYVGWGVIGFVTGILTSPMKAAMVPGFVIFAVITFFLFRPKANEYFLKKDTSDNAQGV